MIERLILGLSIAATCAGAPIDWPHLKLTRVAEGLSEPVCITSARDGTDRIFIAERFGKIKVLVNGVVRPEPFLDISAKLETNHYSHGILDLAFPPAFAAKQHFYVHYTSGRDTPVLSRFHVPAGSAVADPQSEEVLLVNSLYDNGGPTDGPIEFGPDGYLYIGLNATLWYHPQNFDNLLGKILRIDVEAQTNGYAIPPDNPFASHPSYRREIWSWGLVQPHSLSLDRLTGDLYVVDSQGIECEVNFQTGDSNGGVDYGAPAPEYMGNDPYATYERYGATRPVYLLTSSETYGVRGRIYRDASPSRMNGVFFMGGFFSGHLAGLGREGTNWARQDFPEAINPGHAFGVDESGRLYVAARYDGTIDRIEDSGKVRPPVLLPSGVIHTDTPTLRSPSPGARIRYTTDGRDPAPGDPEIPSGQSITISNGMTVKAQALRDDLLPSDISAATYTSFKVAYPIFVPGPGAIPNPSFITITSATPGAIIRYTTNGTHPTASSPIYSSPIVVPGDAIVYARAFRNGFQDSDLNGATYTWGIALAPLFDPASGPITNGTWLTMTSPTPGAKIRYTLDGTQPTATSLKYTNRVRINGNTTVKAITFAKGYKTSSVTTMRFDLVKPATPVFTPSPGTVAYGTMISITSSTAGATIRYTTNGLAPSASSPIYSKPIPIFANTIIKARAFKAQMDPSPVAHGDFRLPATAAPTFTPAGGPLAGNTVITISCATSNAQIRYTLDGTPPGATSSLYRTGFTLVPPVTLSARAFALEMSPSDITTTYFPALIQEPVIVQTVAGTGALGFRDGPAANAMFHRPLGLCVADDGTIYVADTDNNVIRKISTNHVVSTVPADFSTFSQPVGIVIGPQGALYVAETPARRLRIITPDGQVTTLPEVPVSFHDAGIWHIALSSSGLLYIGSSYEIFTMTANRSFSRFAGNRTTWGWVTSVALNPSNRLFAVTGRNLITFDGAQERLVAGGPEGFSDGPGLKARFLSPNGIAVARDKRIFIADGHLVRMFNTGYVSTVAGYAGPGFHNGPGSVAQFSQTVGICVDKKGVIYLTDGNIIRKISFDRDQDTIPDPEDQTVGTDDRLVDSDGDGQSNAEEFWAATNPNDSDSTLKIHARYNGTNGVIVSWPTAPGRSYVLTTSTNLTGWMQSVAIAGDGATMAITNVSRPALRSFYRLRVEP